MKQFLDTVREVRALRTEVERELMTAASTMVITMLSLSIGMTLDASPRVAVKLAH